MPRTTEMKRLREQLVAQGFSVEMCRSGHYRVVAPDGRKCCIAATPRYSRGVLNAVTRLKRIGYHPDLTR